jgi:hypothetical protein
MSMRCWRRRSRSALVPSVGGSARGCGRSPGSPRRHPGAAAWTRPPAHRLCWAPVVHRPVPGPHRTHGRRACDGHPDSACLKAVPHRCAPEGIPPVSAPSLVCSVPSGMTFAGHADWVVTMHGRSSSAVRPARVPSRHPPHPLSQPPPGPPCSTPPPVAAVEPPVPSAPTSEHRRRHASPS